MKYLLKPLVLAAACTALLNQTLLASDISPARQLEVTVVKGKQLPKLLNQDYAAYSVMAMNNGQLQPIPFQFDDLNVKNLVYVPGGKLKIQGKEGVLEENDELAFMYKDMGAKATDADFQKVKGSMVSELEISENGTQRFAYVFKDNAQRSDKKYAYYDQKTGLVTAESYTLQISPKNILVWEDWKIKGFTGTPSAPNILDTMKVRVKAKLGFIKATLHNSMIPVNTLGVKNGPVRSIVEADASLSILGIDLAKGGLCTTFTAQTIQYPLFVAFPKAAGALSDLGIDVTLDFVDFQGSRYRSALGPKEPLITGSKEAAKLREKYSTDLAHPWNTISTGKNWDMFFFFFTDKEFKPSLNAVYTDAAAGDDENGPERFPGSNSEFGPSLTKIPVGTEATLQYNLYFGPDLWQGNKPELAAEQIMHPAVVVVH